MEADLPYVSSTLYTGYKRIIIIILLRVICRLRDTCQAQWPGGESTIFFVGDQDAVSIKSSKHICDDVQRMNAPAEQALRGAVGPVHYVLAARR